MDVFSDIHDGDGLCLQLLNKCFIEFVLKM